MLILFFKPFSYSLFVLSCLVNVSLFMATIVFSTIGVICDFVSWHVYSNFYLLLYKVFQSRTLSF